MRRFLFSVLTFAIALPVAAFAQGSGGSYPRHPRVPAGPDLRPFAVTRSLKATIVEINAEKYSVVVEDKNGKRFRFKLRENAKFRAAKKTELAGRRRISLTDFETGQPVKITYLASNSMATELKLLRAKIMN